MTPVAVLRTRDVPRLLGGSLLGRVPATAIGLLLLLRVQELGGSYAIGGLAAGLFSLGLAVSSPVLGRAIDARGQTLVLRVGAIVSGASLAAAALIPDDTSTAAVLALALLCGAGHPPLSACLRTLWGTVLPDASARHAAFALEASAQELCFILGPLVLVSAVAVHDPSAGLLLAAAILGAGTAVFTTSRPSREWRGTPRSPAGAGAARALAAPGIRTLLAVDVGLGMSFGAIDVGIIASAQDAGSSGATGVLMALWASGSVLGGLVAARRGVPEDRARQVLLLLLALAAADALLVAASGSLAAMALALVLCGAAIAPLFTVMFGLGGDLALPGTVTEAFTWLGTGIASGVALGSAAAGALAASAVGPAGAFLVAASAAAAGAAVAHARRPTLSEPVPAAG